ncbi:1,4-dihydroxy-2-naphthoyl-CoA hydrolase [Dysgonomonas sp. PFB1-18]|uniref:PaaI family thioesterase n=1 Tax=unclassified Dysgonomonas TaxID=2630389 RepID=UPI002473F101|nr:MULTISPECIES: PaaI family thioesterase [unclassified Dysgonomonas]MDH6307706.1 1,4-dihydroxy-2-naphthoyl-CoA hydrolase [Dysgonomonas sp. PF1-14]MDH6337624.1 1,4-dihydroxy-2-naphthoyl-CoA hydrolase [Dysgonomonas sp. PF1-16]MDH6378848.1 1,4-dihydroxy-2-naphthoyl-CoA hydrolase [Dysgonomonas sp. PFB1-18]MDH6396483.1 1,4-dihydroxy-2-naphthoyl-CoA hydrolase [Dysgonomonas sp. PF1-23]
MKIDKNDIQERIKGTLIETLNITFIESDDQTSLEATMPVVKGLSQTMGVLHGGATISLAESIAGVGSNTLCSGDEQCFGMQISASHISLAKVGDVVRAKGIIQHKGRSTHVWNIDVFSESTGHLISTIRITNAVVKKVLYIKKD